MEMVDGSYFSAINARVNLSDYNENHLCICNTKHPFVTQMLLSQLEEKNYLILTVDEKYTINKTAFIDHLSHCLGVPCHKNGSKKNKYAEISAIPHATFYISSNLAQPVHTDEAYTNCHPRYVGLHCLKEAEAGGVSIIVPLSSLYQSLLTHFGDEVNLLFNKEAITVHGADGIKTKSILFKLKDNSIGISYTTVLKQMHCSKEVLRMFDFIAEYIHNPIHQQRFILKKNQILIVDNCKVLHGRTAFIHDAGRLLHRYWFGKVQC